MKGKASVLLVEDDKEAGIILQKTLNESGYKVEMVETINFVLSLFTTSNFDICLIGVAMPKKIGFLVAEEIRKKNDMVPIIFIAESKKKEDKIKGFKLGADDYITKPFSTEELFFRIEAILRRTKDGYNYNGTKVKQEIFSVGKFVFDYTNQEIKLAGNRRTLTNKEAKLLRVLCINKNRLVRRNFALKLIWGEENYFMGRSMDVYITKLRKILKEDPNVKIRNVHHTGYILEVSK